jgi:hypothetical protein
MAWASIDQVEEWLGLPQDQRMADALAVSEAYCHRQRPDLDPDGVVNDDISLAVVLYAAQLYRVRSTPRGIAGYDVEGAEFDTSTEYYRFRDLLGIRKPVAR